MTASDTAFDLAGKTAIVTGAASGIGLGIARAFARAGMRLVLADIQKAKIDVAVDEVRALGAQAVAVVADVSDADAVDAIGREAERAFGKLHVAVNNAGVAMHGSRLEDLSLAEWRWAVDVNVFGVIHGIRAFMPLIRRHGEGGHVVNTASGSGLFIRPGRLQGAYAMTKYAVVALSEALEPEAAEDGIGVSVLCPGAVQSDLDRSARHRPQRHGGAFDRPEEEFLRDLLAGGMSADAVGEAVVAAIRARKFYIFTHANLRAPIEARHGRMMGGFAAPASADDPTGG